MLRRIFSFISLPYTLPLGFLLDWIRECHWGGPWEPEKKGIDKPIDMDISSPAH